MTAGCVTTKGCCGAATVTTAGWYDTAGGGGGGGGCCWFRAAAPCVRAPTISDVRLFMFFLYDGEVLGVRRIRTKAGRRRDGRDVFLRVRARRAKYPRRPRRVALWGGATPYGAVQREGRACRVRAPGRSQFIATVVHNSFTVRPWSVAQERDPPGSDALRTQQAASLPCGVYHPTHLWWTPRAEGGAGTSRAGPSAWRLLALTTPPRLRRHGSASRA